MRIPKAKLHKTKPASQLFMFSNKLNKNVDHWFSGNIVIESVVSDYNFKKHKEAGHATNIMFSLQEHRRLKPFKYITIVLNYKPSAVTMATISGEYEYMLAAHGTRGYKDLELISKALIAQQSAIDHFASYKKQMNIFVDSLESISTPANKNFVKSIRSSLNKSEELIAKSKNIISVKSDKLFGLHYASKKIKTQKPKLPSK